MKKKLLFPVLWIAMPLFVALVLSSCGVQQRVKKSVFLKPNMSRKNVLSIMKVPIKIEFIKNTEEWHYCRSGTEKDDFVTLFFNEDGLIAKTHYMVTVDEEAFGSCENFIKQGNYEEPSAVTELRNRMPNVVSEIRFR